MTARALRVPLAEVVSDLASEASKPATLERFFGELFPDAPPERVKFPPELELDVIPEGWRALPLFPRPPAKRQLVRRARPGRAGHPDSFYRKVAAAYKRAKREHPSAPIQALMDELHASEPTVHRWVRTAEKKGYMKKRGKQ